MWRNTRGCTGAMREDALVQYYHRKKGERGYVCVHPQDSSSQNIHTGVHARVRACVWGVSECGVSECGVVCGVRVQVRAWVTFYFSLSSLFFVHEQPH